MMRCPRCQQENPENGQFCIRCGLPLTENARASCMYTEAQPKKESRTGRFLAGLAKAVCYVLLFILIQSAVIGIYGAYYAMGEMSGMLSGGFGISEDFMYDISEDLMEAVFENISLLTLISGALTILFLAVFFALRHKNLFTECGIRTVPLSALIWCALAGTALNVVVSVTISFLPLPEAWFAGLEEQYQYLGETNIFLEILSTAIMTGLVEETIFRGLAESRIRRGAPGWLTVILSALLFGICHGTPIAIGYAALLGALFSVMNRRYGSILPSVITHIFFNGAALWFVTEDSLLILAMYLICGGVLAGSLYLYFRKNPEEENNSDSVPVSAPDNNDDNQ
ncbi:MAG: CPBP family intramembrane metalloprotease [Ruminococcaceae bacterium]|nr:CPBP family intramembrane metalloprotease [Oscillospiraceae bacterium]